MAALDAYGWAYIAIDRKSGSLFLYRSDVKAAATATAVLAVVVVVVDATIDDRQGLHHAPGLVLYEHHSPDYFISCCGII